MIGLDIKTAMCVRLYAPDHEVYHLSTLRSGKHGSHPRSEAVAELAVQYGRPHINTVTVYVRQVARNWAIVWPVAYAFVEVDGATVPEHDA